MTLILPPVASLDWDKLTVAAPLCMTKYPKFFVTGTELLIRTPLSLIGIGHVESTYKVSTGRWSDPIFIDDPYLRVHGLAPGLQYGTNKYLCPVNDHAEVKAFRTPAGRVSIFRPGEHAKRMNHSASTISIPDIPEALFLACVELAVTSNSQYIPPHTSRAMLYIRPFVFGSSEMIGLVPPAEFKFCVFVKPVSAYHGQLAQDALILTNFDRAAPHGLGNAKVGGNYAPVIKWSEKAKADGFGMTLHLDSKTRTEIDEFSTSGFLGIKVSNDGTVNVVAPSSPCIIESITSDCCLQLAQQFGWTVEMRPIKYTELPKFSEVVAVGTAASVVSIRSITREDSGERFQYLNQDNDQGRYAHVLSMALDSIMRCRAEDTFGWCHQVGQSTLKEKVEDTIYYQSKVTSRHIKNSKKEAAFADIMMLSGPGLGARYSCH
ncbi:Uncharacterized protein HZ326_9074 [Fusarium oxysporum f. sp. albedinis]|nr:Uncharacterized protein HZ326_9074 [Fusarium oxysporum f. sp. albedinis]